MLCLGQCLFGLGQLGLQTRQFGLLLVIAGFELFQLAYLCTQHGGFDLGFLGRFVVGRGGRGCGRRCGSVGCLQRLLRMAGGDTQFGDLCFQLGRGVGGELFFGFLQRDLGHAGFDLELFLFFGQAGFLRLDGGDRVVLAGGLCLGLLGARGAFGTGLAVGFLLLFGATQALLAPFETLPGVFGLLLFLLQCADLALGGAVVLNQRNARGADIGAGAALDAVEQVVGLELLVFLAQGEEMQLLRQQAGRADLGTFTAADAGQRRRRWRQLGQGAGQQAVGGLDQRHVHRWQGEAHHRAAHDQAV